jgi:hypothetical protein
VQQVQQLSGPVFSEIIRNLDPAITSTSDVAGGLRITRDETYETGAAELVDEHGIRRRHYMVLDGMQILLDARSQTPYGLLAGDYEVMMRCAGSAMNVLAVKKFWAAMADHGKQSLRTVKTWTEFLKARFLTEPLYYQYDRTRVAITARAMYRDHNPLPIDKLQRLDGMRLSLNALKSGPWGLVPDTTDADESTGAGRDILRLLRRRHGYRSFIRHWSRADYYGHVMNEELLSVSIIGFSRSSSVEAIHTLIFRNFYKIDTTRNPEDPGLFLISGGRDIEPGSPIKPTVRILDAIVEAFGSMSLVGHGLQLMVFMSRRYDIPIPSHTWSTLLHWAYVCSSRPFRPMREIQDSTTNAVVTSDMVRQIWDIMTSEPYDVQPTFEDYDCIIKTLIVQRQIHPALDAIRDFALPYYRDIVNQHEAAILEEIVHNDHASQYPVATATAIHDRQCLEARRDHVRHVISSWFESMLKFASKSRSYREGPVMQVLIPDLLREFDDEFFDKVLSYRTAQGFVELTRPNARRRSRHSIEVRETLPQRIAGFRVTVPEEMSEESYRGHDLPLVAPMKVLYLQKTPIVHDPLIGQAPSSRTTPEGQRWWRKLEKRLIS